MSDFVPEGMAITSALEMYATDPTKKLSDDRAVARYLTQIAGDHLARAANSISLALPKVHEGKEELTTLLRRIGEVQLALAALRKKL